MSLQSETDLRDFYNVHYKASVQRALRIVNDLPEAEDIVQECMVKLWDRRQDLSKKDNLSLYFRKMVRNRSIDYLRRRIPLDHTAEVMHITEIQTDQLEYAELSGSIDDLIDSLPEKCRQIFVLSRFEQMTYKEISEKLNISAKTVENQISRALKTLRKGLGHYFFLFFI
jgi:RNA polymerase sigma-70 factor (ECF subfamily)